MRLSRVRLSRVREKLNNRQPVIVTKINSLDPVFADMVGQITRRMNRRIEQHGFAAKLLGHPGGIKPAQR